MYKGKILLMSIIKTDWFMMGNPISEITQFTE